MSNFVYRVADSHSGWPRRLTAYVISATAAPVDPVLANLARDIAGRAPAEVLVWTGAGISAPGPTSLPTGREFIDRAFRAFFEPEALATVLAYHARAGWFTRPLCDRTAALPTARLPRLETVIGVAERVIGDRVHRVLDDIRYAEPNHHHAFLAGHLAAAGRQVTANFDTCVEIAFERLTGSAPAPDSVIHFHHALGPGATAHDLGVTLDRVQGGLDDHIRADLVRLVGSSSMTLFVGYSASDFFDVDVAFGKLAAGSLADREVVWVQHGSCGAWHEITPVTQPPLTRLLSDAGARVRFFCGQTDALFEALAGHWGFRVGAPKPTPRVVRDTLPTITGAQRRAATFALYRELGMIGEVERMLDEGDLTVDPTDLLEARSEVLWEQGRWNTLRRLWRRLPLPPGISAARQSERIGATYWNQGRFIPALVFLTRQRRTAERNHLAEDAAMLDETAGRVIEHMARTPELRLAAKLLARRAVKRLSEPNQKLGIHLFRRRTDLINSLRVIAGHEARTDGIAAASQRWFTEAGSMIGAIAYGHRALRDSYSPDAPVEETRRRYRAHFRWASAVGTAAGAWRCVLLPDAARVYSPGEVLASVSVLQYGPWHRLRILARYGAKRLTGFIRR